MDWIKKNLIGWNVLILLMLVACKPNKKQLIGEWKLADVVWVGDTGVENVHFVASIEKIKLQLADKYFFFDQHNRYGIINDFGDTLQLTNYTSTATKVVIDDLENNYEIKMDTLFIQEIGRQAQLKMYRLQGKR